MNTRNGIRIVRAELANRLACYKLVRNTVHLPADVFERAIQSCSESGRKRFTIVVLEPREIAFRTGSSHISPSEFKN